MQQIGSIFKHEKVLDRLFIYNNSTFGFNGIFYKTLLNGCKTKYKFSSA